MILTFNKQSSNISKVSYDSTDQSLAVQFRNGRTYLYSNVPSTLVAEMIERVNKKNESLGKVFNELIRDNETIQYQEGV